LMYKKKDRLTNEDSPFALYIRAGLGSTFRNQTNQNQQRPKQKQSTFVSRPLFFCIPTSSQKSQTKFLI
ncbi:hypothetical protein OF387_15190, partial [Lentilactobacillus hilgardii]